MPLPPHPTSSSSLLVELTVYPANNVHSAAMAQGRSSAVAVAVAILCLLLVAHCRTAESAIYTVGDSAGWGFSTGSWSRGKSFKAGDVIVFRYSPQAHNVVAVNAAGYNSCKTPRGSRVFKTGNDRIRLSRGTNYFICNFVGHCESGMKIAITAA